MKHQFNKILPFLYFKVFSKIDRLYWKFDDYPIERFREIYEIQENEIKIFHPEVDPTGNFDIKDIFAKHLIDIQTKYLYRFNVPTYLEPRHFWLIEKKTEKILKRSRHNVFDPWGSPPPLPSLMDKMNIFKKRINLPYAIPIPKYMWFNYYHFFFDVVSQVIQLREFGISKDIPIIAPYKAKEVQYIKDFMKLSNLFHNQAILFLKDNEFVHIGKEAIVVKNSYMNKQMIHTLLDSIDYRQIQPYNNVPKKVFLTRDIKRNRTLKNIKEIEQLANSFGFEVVDTDGWSLAEQIAFFSKVEHVIGLHGAGLTNLLFGKDSIKKVLEIMPGDLNPGFYMHLSMILGIQYKKIFGSKRELNENFYLNPTLFEQALNEFMF